MTKPAGPTPPDGYRWVPKGQIVWPTDVTMSTGFNTENKVQAAVFGLDWKPAEHEFNFLRPKVTQPELQWLKSKAVKYAESLPEHLDREKARWQIAEAVRLYSGTLMAMIREQEQYRPDQKREGGDV